MAKSNTLAHDYLDYFFRAGTITALPAAGGSIYVCLFTADPTAAASYFNEANYTSYARQVILRQSTGNGWSLTSTAPMIVANLAAITFPLCSGGSETETYFGLSSSPTRGAGTLFYSGPLASAFPVSNGVQPAIAIGGLTVQEV